MDRKETAHLQDLTGSAGIAAEPVENGPRAFFSLSETHLFQQGDDASVVADAMDLKIPLQFESQLCLESKPLLLQLASTVFREPAV